MLPLALQFGMPTREFWNDDPELLWTYRKMYMDKIKIQRELENQQAWLQGLYFFNAMSISIYNAFGRKSGQPAQNYMESPIDFDNIKTKEEIEREKQLQMEEQIRKRNKEIKLMLEKK